MLTADLTRGQAEALKAMLSTSWVVDGPTLRSLKALGLVEQYATGHRLTYDGREIACTMMAVGRKAGAA